jgi:hypothetical protein
MQKNLLEKKYYWAKVPTHKNQTKKQKEIVDKSRSKKATLLTSSTGRNKGN